MFLIEVRMSIASEKIQDMYFLCCTKQPFVIRVKHTDIYIYVILSMALRPTSSREGSEVATKNKK